ncbi:MAG: T9SS type A sorting domain-containing protein [Ignavibacteriae bacterium]|nr:T9SS type A sorting domain-containing protein [Ignavibacteriota bacterium]
MKRQFTLVTILFLSILFACTAIAQLSGIKTIGGAAPDYASIKAALLALKAQGVTSPGVTFAIRTGTYAEDSLIVRTSTATAGSPIVFKPDVGATVVINVTPPSTSFNFAIKIDSTKYVTFQGSNNNTTSRDMTINALGANGRQGVWFFGNCSYGSIKNCIVTAQRDAASPSISSYCINFESSTTGSGNDADFALIENNLTRYAYYGIRCVGVRTGDCMESPIIRNNVVDSVTNTGIYTTSTNYALIHGNDINTKRGSATGQWGILVSGGTFKTRVYNNRVHDMNQLGAFFTYGIYINSASDLGQQSVFNNFVWNLNVPASGGGTIYGIYSGATNQAIPDTFAFNTVYLSGGGAGSKTSYAFGKASSGAPVVAYNNIFQNSRSDSGGISAAIYKSTAAAVLLSNNNNLYVASTSAADTTHVVGAIGTVKYQKIQDWRAGNGSDVQSFDENTPFLSATDLHIQTGVPTLIESGAIPFGNISIDIDGNARQVNFPDVGADEGGFSLLDQSAPTIAHTFLGGTAFTGNRVAVATIADPSGIATGAGSPRLWHKRSTDVSFTSIVADSVRGSAYYFTIPGHPTGTTVQYYLAAQDASTNNNFGTLPVGGSGINPPGSTPPAIPISYVVQAPLASGTYTIGSGGNFPTLDSAFNKLRFDGVAGTVTFNLIDSLYLAPGKPLQNLRLAQSKFTTVNGVREDLALPSAYEYDAPDTVGALSLQGPIVGASATSRVTFRPAPGVNARLVGNGAWVARMLDASYVTWDGINAGGTSLRVNATAGYGIVLEGNSDFCTVQNISFATPSFTSIVLQTRTADAPDSIMIRKNTVGGYSFNGVFMSDLFPGATGISRNIRVTDNDFGTATDSIAQAGIIFQFVNGLVIDNNRIRNVYKSTLAGNTQGIVGQFQYFNAKIYRNIIRDISRRSGSTASSVYGINLFGATPDTTNVDIYNNMIYGLDNQSTSTSGIVGGIQVSTGINDTIAYNTVYLTGNDAAAIVTSALRIGNPTAGARQVWRNNIAINARITTGTGRAIAFYVGTTTGQYSSNYNDLYVPTRTGSHIASVFFTNYTTLAAWQATGPDVQSVSVMANFRTPDLHIDSTIASPINAGATPIAGITSDFDGQTRSATTPDIGADEIGPITDVNDQTLLQAPTTYALYQNYPNPFNPSTTIRFQIPEIRGQTSEVGRVTLKVYDVLGKEVATLVNENLPAGTYETTFDVRQTNGGQANGLASGVYFYRLTAGGVSDSKRLLLLK